MEQSGIIVQFMWVSGRHMWELKEKEDADRLAKQAVEVEIGTEIQYSMTEIKSVIKKKKILTKVVE